MTCDSELDCIEDNSGNNKGGERQTRGQRPFFTLTGLNNILLFQIEMNTWIASSSLKALVNFLDKATTLHKGKNDSESVKQYLIQIIQESLLSGAHCNDKNSVVQKGLFQDVVVTAGPPGPGVSSPWQQQMHLGTFLLVRQYSPGMTIFPQSKISKCM